MDRFILLRKTAFPDFFDTVKPRRPVPDVPGENKTVKCLLLTLLPAADNLRNSFRFRILLDFEKLKFCNFKLLSD